MKYDIWIVVRNVASGKQDTPAAYMTEELARANAGKWIDAPGTTVSLLNVPIDESVSLH